MTDPINQNADQGETVPTTNVEGAQVEAKSEIPKTEAAIQKANDRISP